MRDNIEADDFSVQSLNQVSNEVVYPTKCFIETSLSSIFIPNYLLLSAQSDSNSVEFNRSIFHTLQKDNAFQSIAGFSTYDDLPEDEEIFESDSDNEFLNSDTSVEDDLLKNNAWCSTLSCQDLLSHPSNESDTLQENAVPSPSKFENSEELPFKLSLQKNVSNSSCHDLLSHPSNELYDLQENSVLAPSPKQIDNSEELPSKLNAVKHCFDFEWPKNLEIGESNAFETFRKGESKNPVASVVKGCNTNSDEIKMTNANIVIQNSQASLSKAGIQNCMDFVRCEHLERENILGTLKVDRFQINESLGDKDNTQQQSEMSGVSKVCTSTSYNPDLDLRDFSFNYKKKDSKEFEVEAEKMKEKRHRERRQKKLKKKAARYIEIDDSGSLKNGQIYLNDSLTDARMHDFIQSIVQSKQNGYSDVLPIHSTSEFPNLEEEKNEIKFIKSDKSSVEPPKVDMKSVAEVFSKSIEESVSEVPVAVAESPKIYKKIAIDNIPKNAPEEDIKSMISSFGDIKSFKSCTDKDFQRVIIEVDSSCDIDWVIECLNDSDAFGAFSETLLRCYCL